MDLEQLLGDEADSLLNYTATAFPSDWLTLPGPTYLDDVMSISDRPPDREAFGPMLQGSVKTCLSAA